MAKEIPPLLRVETQNIKQQIYTIDKRNEIQILKAYKSIVNISESKNKLTKKIDIKKIVNKEIAQKSVTEINILLNQEIVSIKTAITQRVTYQVRESKTIL